MRWITDRKGNPTENGAIFRLPDTTHTGQDGQNCMNVMAVAPTKCTI